jgi:Glycosyl transferase family 2
MMRPKYSIALPTLNGGKKLSLTLPAMLEIDRDDIEWVISNNLSEDDTKDVVLGFDDKRIRYVEPPERLHHSRHLEFAYTNARGLWQGHLGDDDIIFPSRFDVLDDVMKNTDAMVIRGGNLRYFWHDYPNPELANRVDQALFNGALYEMSGSDFAANQLNELVVFGGGSWVVHSKLIDKIRTRCGYFASPRHVEFFAMRAAVTAAEKVAMLSLPIWILGRHGASSANQVMTPKNEQTEKDWDWSLEYPEPWYHCPFDWHAYANISLDGALTVLEHFPELGERVQIDWVVWINRVIGDMERMIAVDRLPIEIRERFEDGLRRLPAEAERAWQSRDPAKDRKYYPPARLPIHGVYDNMSTLALMGWPKNLRGADAGFTDIADLARWVEKTYAGFFASRTIPF